MQDSKIDILLASYNGESFISQQIESILGQSFADFRLIISDDGSTDSTWEIVTHYAELDSRIQLVDNIRKGGVINNFNCCMQHSKAEYIMFCDQDDFWPAGKVEEMFTSIKKINNYDGTQPLLCFSDLTVVNKDLDVLNPSFYAYLNLNPLYNTDYRYILWRSTVYGCTVIFNRVLLNRSMPLPENIPMHDHWLALNASHSGIIHYHNHSTVLYRQHGGNVIGAVNKNKINKVLNLIKAIKRIKKYSFEVKQMICHLSNRSGSNATDLEINNIIQRIKFVKQNIVPFFSEKAIFTSLFIIFFVFNS